MPSKHVTNVDSQRILSIMDELKEKISLLCLVNPQLLEALQGEDGAAVSELLGADLLKQLTDQIKLEEMYVANQASDGYAQEGETEEPREDEKSLKKNTLEVCRKMRVVPNIVQELRHFDLPRPEKMVSFLKTLVEMQELFHKRLTTTVEEEKSKQELLEHYKVKEADASKRRFSLEKDLNHIRREKDRSQTHRQEILTKLKADLQDVKDNKESRMKELKERYDNRYAEYQEQFKIKQTQYKAQIDALKAKNLATRKDNEKAEQDKRHKQVKRVEKDVKEQIEIYDGKIYDMAYELKEVTENFEREKKQLKELKDHFLKVDAEKDCIGSEEGITGARKAKVEYELGRRNDASATVQAFWRGIRQREEFGVLKKSKKGKAGKKKGK